MFISNSTKGSVTNSFIICVYCLLECMKRTGYSKVLLFEKKKNLADFAIIKN